MSDKWIDIGEGLTWQVLQQMWRVFSSHFPFDDDFFAFGQKENMITDLGDSFYFSYASLFDHYW